MSATISDDSMLVRTFDGNPDSLSKSISSNSLAGVSERMILAPDLMKFDLGDTNAEIKLMAPWMAGKHKKSTVILSPSIPRATKWNDIAVVADTPEKVSEYVKSLQDGSSYGPFVFANRYDGIDLPNSACRLLIMEGLPHGANSYDMFRASVFYGGEEARSSIARRIEQGIGRGARGGGDYCVVILAGNDLVGWIDRPANEKYLTQSTQAQLTIGKSVSEAITSRDDLYATIWMCLQRNPEWTSYHAETLSALVQSTPADETYIRYASVERKTFDLFRQNEFENAVGRLVKHCQDANGNIDRQATGWLKQLAARIAYWGNLADWESLQKDAYFLNNNLHRPLTDIKHQTITIPHSQAKAIVSELQHFNSRKGFIAHFDSVVSLLSKTSSSNQFEESLAKFGKFLGFATDRPDNNVGKGPDVFWLLDSDKALVIEAKSKKLLKNPLSKDEHAQLLEADEWFKNEYSNYTSTRVSMHPSRNVRYEPSITNTKVMTFEKLNELIMAARKLYISLDGLNLPRDQKEVKCEEILNEFSLTPTTLVAKYLEDFIPFNASPI